MDLISRFRQVSTGAAVPQTDMAGLFGRTAAIPIPLLEQGRRYPVIHAHRITTPYGPTVMLTLGATPSMFIKVFLPARFTPVFEDTDITSINDGTNTYHFVFLGRRHVSGAYILSLEH